VGQGRIAQRLKDWARRLIGEIATLWFCARHPRTPLSVKLLAAAVAAYAFSPIDLIPDFIPVLGYLDDLILLPIGVWLVLKLAPPDVIVECREQARIWMEAKRPKPRSYFGAALIAALWLAALALAWHFLAPSAR
jgi:uncharacterized membrane protein YkvA (DUF1232 family)